MMLTKDNTENIWAHRFLAKQKNELAEGMKNSSWKRRGPQ